MHIERERRWLIHLYEPAWEGLSEPLERVLINQIYLTGHPGRVARVRQVVDDSNHSTYHYTVKEQIRPGESYEDEREIDEETFLSMVETMRDPTRTMITKERFRISHWELDYFFVPELPDDQLILELENPPDEIQFPKWAIVVREITGDPEWSNYNLARRSWDL
jgi:CYTH domain-containing protein